MADYAEGLCKLALNLTLADKCTTGYDGTDPTGKKIEIKARRLTKHNGSRQLSAIRGIDKQHFDYLAGVLFNADFTVLMGCLIPMTLSGSTESRTSTRTPTNFCCAIPYGRSPGCATSRQPFKEAERTSARRAS